MKLRSGILLGIAAIVVGIVTATVFAVTVVVNRGERSKVEDALEIGHVAFDELLRHRASMYRSDCRLVAHDSRLRSLVAMANVPRESINVVIGELAATLGSDLLLVTDPTGTVVGDAAEPEAEGNIARRQAVVAARQRGDGSGVWMLRERPYQISACRIDVGRETTGMVVIGRVMDDAMAESVRRQTGSPIVVMLDGARVAASLFDGDEPPTGELLASLGELDEVVIAGERYLTRTAVIPDYDGPRALVYTMLRSLDAAYAPARQLTWTIFGIAAIALLAALALAFALSQRLARPIHELVQFTRAVGKGRMDRRAAPGGATEVRALAAAMNAMVEELDQSRRTLADKDRLERELEIAARIQTSILPKHLDVPGLDIAARMLPASEVGGDYYDIIPTESGCWIGIGDVAGHGLAAGLEMLMVQSVIAGLVHDDPQAAPRDHVCVLNHVLFENIRDRMGQDEHVTLTLLRYASGTFTFAGAHEEILVCRAAGGPCERVPTPGAWIGGMRDISRVTRDSTVELVRGDLMVLYTDGITEARDGRGRQFGDARLAYAIEAVRDQPVAVIRDRIIDAVQAWQRDQHDDIVVVVIRQR